jgi:hypothetical protein
MSFFPKINESFVCQNCGKENPPAPKTCRNHCRECLFSLHVDVSPGDRAANCGGLMEPVRIEVKGSEMRTIVFRCRKCGKEGNNKIAEDDDRSALFCVFEKKIKD